MEDHNSGGYVRNLRQGQAQREPSEPFQQQNQESFKAEHPERQGSGAARHPYAYAGVHALHTLRQSEKG